MASSKRVDDTQYRASHGAPRGHGRWLFAQGHAVFDHTGTYSEAVAALKASSVPGGTWVLCP